MGSLDILYFNPFNLRNKIIKVEYKKYFMAYQIFWKIFHSPSIYISKIFHCPHTNLPLPPLPYILNVRSLTKPPQ